jgi:ketosteroid isomerase-like protein
MSNSPVKDIVEAVNRKCQLFEKYFFKKDAHALVDNYYTEEPIVSGDGVGLVIGRPKVQEYFEQIFELFDKCSFNTQVLKQEGNMAYELGEVTLFPKNSEDKSPTLRYSLVWIWQDSDGWRAEVDYFAFVAD